MHISLQNTVVYKIFQSCCKRCEIAPCVLSLGWGGKFYQVYLAVYQNKSFWIFISFILPPSSCMASVVYQVCCFKFIRAEEQWSNVHVEQTKYYLSWKVHKDLMFPSTGMSGMLDWTNANWGFVIYFNKAAGIHIIKIVWIGEKYSSWVLFCFTELAALTHPTRKRTSTLTYLLSGKIQWQNAE